jgi:hypothetical protein
MLQTCEDYYRAAVDTDAEGVARFWLGVSASTCVLTPAIGIGTPAERRGSTDAVQHRTRVNLVDRGATRL